MIKRLLASSSIYVLASVFGGVVGLVLVPILTRVLTPADYGIVGLVRATLGIMAPFIALSPNLFLTHKFEEMPRDELRAYVGAAIPVFVVTVAVAAAALVVLRLAWSDFSVPVWILGGMLLMAVAGRLSAMGLDVLMMRRQAKHNGLTQIARAAGSAALTLLFVLVLGLGWQGWLLGTWVAEWVTAAGLAVWLGRAGYLTTRVDWKKTREYVAYSAPLTLHLLSFWAVNAQDRYFIGAMVDLEAVGLYSVGYTLSAVLGFVHLGIFRAVLPDIHQYARSEDARDRERIVVLTWVYVALSFVLYGLFLLGLWLFLPLLVGENFLKAWAFVPWIALGHTFNSVRNCISSYFYIANRTGTVARLSLAVALCNAALNYVLIKATGGAIGAAYATAISFALLAIVGWILAARVHPMPWASALRKAPSMLRAYLARRRNERGSE